MPLGLRVPTGRGRWVASLEEEGSLGHVPRVGAVAGKPGAGPVTGPRVTVSFPAPGGEPAPSSLRVSKACLQNVFSVLLILIYLLLMAVAGFLVYQTITDFQEKLRHPVMSVSYKEVDRYDAPGIALYPGQARLLSCQHHYEVVPPLRDPARVDTVNCTTQRINYTDPFSNQTLKSALIVRGPREVKKRELVFLQFSLSGGGEDFSAIDYLLFSSYQSFLQRGRFMQACESASSSWKFSGGFRTWVKMSLVETKEEDGRQAMEFRQETSVVNYVDQRPVAERGTQLFFVVFEWKDPFIQKVQDVSTACSVHMADSRPGGRCRPLATCQPALREADVSLGGGRQPGGTGGAPLGLSKPHWYS
ncbi:proton-activated chloride channel isoform X2 [Erinaceus europaeus]|uniref:Proton-activated chloride channel n=1 Tax=Erinaceus europaeus TaxID=9365 RepID=A0ABM3WCU1_ERIEU|nr:proton-activated chloride channel isoform X2 [Erinaceus europaeus]